MVAHLPAACVRIAALITALAIVGVMVTVARTLETGFGPQVQAYGHPGLPTLMASVGLSEDVEDALDDVMLNESLVETPHTELQAPSRKAWLKPYHADERSHRPPIR